jgi:NMD protein affecting ribosome stability and mRNA decay
MKQDKFKCKKCGKNYNSLADGVCFFCDKEHWYSYFKKLAGKGEK